MKYWMQAMFIFFCLFPGLSSSAVLTSINVEQQQERYILHIKAEINANFNTVKRLITDYENLPLINSYLKESSIISTSEDNRTTVSMLTEACILFICYKVRHVQIFQLIGQDIVYSKIIPKTSDFHYGWTRWKIKEDTSSMKTPVTQITLDAEMTHDFFVLPIIGPYQLKKKILEIVTITINNLEKEAQKNQIQ